MRVPFDIKGFEAHIAAFPRNPRGPVDAQRFAVTLPAPETSAEEYERWDVPDAWCRENVQPDLGELWSRRRDQRTGKFVFSFSAECRAALFTLFFKGA